MWNEVKKTKKKKVIAAVASAVCFAAMMYDHRLRLGRCCGEQSQALGTQPDRR